jgi:hypothetical protein
MCVLLIDVCVPPALLLLLLQLLLPLLVLYFSYLNNKYLQ